MASMKCPSKNELRAVNRAWFSPGAREICEGRGAGGGESKPGESRCTSHVGQAV